jgi:tight adherence protein C
MTNLTLGAMMSAGAFVGLGLFLLAVHLIPAPPALGPALHRLHPVGGSSALAAPATQTWIRRHLRVPHSDLRLLGRTSDQYFLTLGLSALFGLLAPVLFGVVIAIFDLSVPLVVPFGGSLAAGVLAALSAHQEVITKAKAARAEFARAMCTFLDLAAHQVLAGHGPVESLNRAASISHGWVFRRIREALLSAELQLRPPWEDLKALGVDIQVIELDDLADIMRTAGTEGANVYGTLRARADSLRDQLRTQALAEAEVRTSKLDIPAGMLVFVLVALLGFPFLARLF